MLERKEEVSFSQVKHYLRNGYKVAISVAENIDIFAQKTDYIAQFKCVNNNALYVDYDGNIAGMLIDKENKVIYHAPYHTFKNWF